MLGSVRGVVSNDHSYRDKANPRVLTLFRARKATRFGRTIARSERPGVVEEPGMCRSSLDGNREIPSLASCGAPLWPASGRRGAVADDERTWEVRLRNSSWEADEQSRATGCGVGGAKCGGRGECEPAKHAPGAGPGKCVTGAVIVYVPGLIHFWTRLSSCACAATGHAAAPPTGVVNSRRFIQAVLRLMTNSMLGHAW